MRILFFSPNAAIWQHAFPEALIAEALRERGHELYYVRCGRLLAAYCTPMTAHRLVPDAPAAAKARVCRHCARNQGVLDEAFGFAGGDLASRITAADREEVAAVVASATPENYLELTVAGLAVGKIACYEMVLTYKKLESIWDAAQWRHFQTALTLTLLAQRAMTRIVEEFRPDRAFMYNAAYSVNNVTFKLCRQRGVIVYALHSGPNLACRLSTMMIAAVPPEYYYAHLIATWKTYRDVPCDPRYLAPVTDHFLELFKGQNFFVYSTPKRQRTELRAHFGVRPDQKVLLATLGSHDEVTALCMLGNPPPYHFTFDSQITWLRALGEYAQRHPEVFLIIRVHPREFPNKRDAVKSQHAQMLEAALQGLPANARVNWPRDQLSVYDLAEETDVVLNSWSSVGKEMTLLGLPAVTYTDCSFFPPELGYFGKTPAAYFAAIEQALAEGWSLERVRQGYRWHIHEFHRMVLDLGDSYDFQELLPSQWGRRLGHGLRRRLLPAWQQRADCRRRARPLRAGALLDALVTSGHETLLDLVDPAALPAISREEETRLLKGELRRLMAALYGRAGPEVRPGTLRAHLTAAVRQD